MNTSVMIGDLGQWLPVDIREDGAEVVMFIVVVGLNRRTARFVHKSFELGGVGQGFLYSHCFFSCANVRRGGAWLFKERGHDARCVRLNGSFLENKRQ